jgi:hypothetical protein
MRGEVYDDPADKESLTKAHMKMLLAEKQSLVRLIIQRPTDGALLLRRYPSDASSSDARYFREDDYGAFDEDDYNALGRVRSGTVLTAQHYWSFKGLTGFKFLGGETQLSEPVRRLAYQQLGILMRDLSLVHVVRKPHTDVFVLERFYVHTSDWTGTLPKTCDPSMVFRPGNAHNGEHEWVDPRFLDCYTYHPEVKAAVKACKDRIVVAYNERTDKK